MLSSFLKLTFLKNYFRNTVRVSNRLDPDLDQHSVDTDLGLNCLQILIYGQTVCKGYKKMTSIAGFIARRLRAKFWPDCTFPDTSMKFGTVVDHD